MCTACNVAVVLPSSSVFIPLQSSCPDWKDAKSIVAMLRLCNYSVDECISMYRSINDDGTDTQADVLYVLAYIIMF